ncbi:hypothetical protein DY138_03210 [Apilactobacillus timberlakei]|nr:hypothetical protein DY138_03210 [Apilactobacillus timberlakei]TPR22689.1 hypothetical protein DY083_04120 [Apilactobacillus timberlakei]
MVKLKINKIGKSLIILTSLIGSQLLFENKDTNASEKIEYKNVNPNKNQSLILGLKNHNNKQLNNFIYQTVTPGNKNYRKYLTPKQFGVKYGLDNKKLKIVGKYFKKHNLKAYTYPGNIIMSVNGKTKDIEKIFKLKIKKTVNQKNNYQTTNDKYYINKTLSKYISYVDQDSLKQNFGKTPSKRINTDDNKSQNPFSRFKEPNMRNRSYKKFTNNYKANSLYKNSHYGQNQKIGIMANADFNIKDIKQYLKAEGLNSSTKRIKKIYVDKDISKDEGDQGEVTMDVEQSSAIAPKSQINVYIGDNVDNNDFVKSYARAIGKDNVDVLSASYSIDESDYKKNDKDVGEFKMLNLLFQQAAAQGISSFNATGDSGAYDFDNGKHNLSTTFPASSPYMTSVGGTTLPMRNISFSVLNNITPNIGFKLDKDKVVSLNHEIAWDQQILNKLFGKNYVKNEQNKYFNFLITNAKTDQQKELIKKQMELSKNIPVSKKLESLGASGGGFSKYFELPKYQKGISGTGRYNARNYVNFKNGDINYKAKLIKGNKDGRNVPDISGNADIITGYDEYFKGHMDPMGGNGTSIVTPQMAGMAAVINSAHGKRMGFWNPQIYRFAKSNNSPFTPLNSLEDNNLFYTGQPKKIYNQATGLGTINFTKLNKSFYKNK